VTQEELAEYLGVSRSWYARFESGAPAAFSIPLLNRLGDILLLSPSERAELVRLAKPEFVPFVERESTYLYDALGSVREAVKRLWTATSEGEILHIAGEETRRLVPCFELIFVRRIVALEEVQFPQPGAHSTARLAEARAYGLRLVTPEQLAGLDALWQPTSGGDLVPISAYPPDWLRLYRLVLHEYGIDWSPPLAAHIRGSSGSALVGGTSTHPHDVTEFERTMLSTIADFASLALE
jgi:transcriptional regulator with XRE-family HTH domain